MNGVIHLILGVQIENGKHTVNSKKSYVVPTPSYFFRLFTRKIICILMKSLEKILTFTFFLSDHTENGVI